MCTLPLRNSELPNGRLAMMSIDGILSQDGLTGSAWDGWASCTESPRAFEKNLGLQAHAEFWDRARFTAVQLFVHFPGFFSSASVFLAVVWFQYTVFCRLCDAICIGLKPHFKMLVLGPNWTLSPKNKDVKHALCNGQCRML